MSLRFNIEKINNYKKIRITSILVVLEGIPDVINLIKLIFKFSQITNYKIIIRTHPVLRYSSFTKFLNKYDLNERIYISETESLDSNFKDSQICIYWGSAVCLDAILFGIPVLHFNEGKFLSYDPLFELEYFKWDFNNEKQLIKVINKIELMDSDEYYIHRNKAQNYIKKYLYSNDHNNMYKFIEKI